MTASTAGTIERQRQRTITGMIAATLCAATLSGCAGSSAPVASPGHRDRPIPIDGSAQDTAPAPIAVEPIGDATQDLSPADTQRYAREYEANWSFERIGVAALHARGATGAGVVIGIADVDSSPQHRELAGKYEIDDQHRGRWHGRAHGGAVAALMVAARDGIGMHGIAYDATLASIAGYGTSSEKLTWLNEVHPEVLLVNSSVGGSLGPDSENYLAQARQFVARGGVIVYATGNQRARNPEATAAAPSRDATLEKGWLAVASMGQDGRFADHADRCGIAAPWCLVAPGMEIYTIDGDTTADYAQRYGTSYAAPLVTSGIAALKSLFPNLSFQQLRVRVLHTADRSGEYANERVYGQGRLDLEAAASPIGALHMPSGAHAQGPIHRADGTRATIARRRARALADTTALMVDGYQRAPFHVRLGTFVTERRSLLAIDDLALGAARHNATETEPGVRVRWERSTSTKPVRLAPSGPYAAGENTVRARTHVKGPGATWMLSGTARTGPLGPKAAVAGMASWAPRHVLAARVATPGERHAVELTLGHDLRRPGGLASDGALRVTGHATSVRYVHRARVTPRVQTTLHGTLTRLARRTETALIDSEALWMGSAAMSATLKVSPHTALTGALAIERTIGTARTGIRIAQTIDERGALRYRSVTIDEGALSDLHTAQVTIVHQLNSATTIGAGAGWAEDGHGTHDALIAIRANARF